MFKMRAFGTIAILIAAAIVVFNDRLLKKQFCLLYFFGNNGNVSKPQRRAVGLNHFH